LRLFRRGRARFAPLPVHEYLEVDGDIARLGSALDHYPCTDPQDMERKRDFYREALAASYSLKKKSRLLILLRPFARFLGNYVLKFGFLDGAEGLRTALTDFRTITGAALLYIKKSRGA
jgi:hypothetical protein